MADFPAQAEAEANLQEPYDTSDPKTVNTARKRTARHEREKLDFVASIMNQPVGRRWFYDNLEFCHIFESSIVQGDPHGTYFQEGERNVGLRLLSDVMQAAPDQYVTMVREGKAPRR